MMDLPLGKSPSKRRNNHKAISFLARSNNAIKGGKFSNIFHVLANRQQDEQGSAMSKHDKTRSVKRALGKQAML